MALRLFAADCAEHALHGCDTGHLTLWVRVGTIVWEMEMPGATVLSDKVIGLRARLVRRVGGMSEMALRLFAADCAERALPLFESYCPNDARPSEAIAAARSGDSRRMAAAASAAYSAERQWQGKRLLAWIEEEP